MQTQEPQYDHELQVWLIERSFSEDGHHMAHISAAERAVQLFVWCIDEERRFEKHLADARFVRGFMFRMNVFDWPSITAEVRLFDSNAVVCIDGNPEKDFRLRLMGHGHYSNRECGELSTARQGRLLSGCICIVGALSDDKSGSSIDVRGQFNLV